MQVDQAADERSRLRLEHCRPIQALEVMSRLQRIFACVSQCLTFLMPDIQSVGVAVEDLAKLKKARYSTVEDVSHISLKSFMNSTNELSDAKMQTIHAQGESGPDLPACTG